MYVTGVWTITSFMFMMMFTKVCYTFLLAPFMRSLCGPSVQSNDEKF